MNPTTKSPPPESLVQQVATRAVMTEALSSRAVQEVQAALVVAKRFPRDEFAAIEKIKTACKRTELAEMAEYEYERGGTKITGPTIDLLKAIAKRWGNIEYGWQELERSDGKSTVRAYAWDMESNARSEMVFVVKHWRDTKSGGYALKDERDIYEATANFAARRVRACLESVVDSDIVQTALDECRKTLKGQNQAPIEDRTRKMVSAFKEFGVTQAMLETFMGNKLEAVSENQLAKLTRVYKSLKDGVGEREDFFKPENIVKVETADDGDLGPENETPKARGEEPEKQPRKKAAKPAPEPASNVGLTLHQQGLMATVTGAGLSFDDLREWLRGDFWDEEACANYKLADWVGFESVPEQVAKQLMRAPDSLVKGIKDVKEVVP